jgi:hypothetical protein
MVTTRQRMECERRICCFTVTEKGLVSDSFRDNFAVIIFYSAYKLIMGPPSTGMNQKQAAGRAKKEQVAAQKQALKQKEIDTQMDAQWQIGANTKRMEKIEKNAQQSDETIRKRQEKQALLAAEEEAMNKNGASKKVSNAVTNKNNNSNKNSKKKNDLSFLEDALVSAADKKMKQKKIEIENRQHQEEERIRKKEQQNQQKSGNEMISDPLLLNTALMIGDAIRDMDDHHSNDDDGGDDAAPSSSSRLNAPLNNNSTEVGGSGIDAALHALSMTGGDHTTTTTATTTNANVVVMGIHGQPLKSAKALYNDYEQRMLPTMKEEYPGLRLTQYKEKIWSLWKKSPENPANQIKL